MKCVSSTPVSEYALGMRSYFFIALACAFAAFSVLLQPAIGAEDDSGIQKVTVEELTQKAEAGDDVAQVTLGIAYERGEGVTQDLKEAANWYRKAAEQGNAEAQLALGRCYASRYVLVRDHKEAAKWYRKAAEQGNADAQRSLGFCYLLGEGVPQDLKEAIKLFRKAAEQGDPRAQRQLGWSYRLGKGVIQDFVQAHAWFNVASANGNLFAEQSRAEVANGMTPEQIAKAQELAREYFEKYQPEE